jgi:cytochrome c oxidase assembly factor CtaG/putative copper export protein
VATIAPTEHQVVVRPKTYAGRVGAHARPTAARRSAALTWTVLGVALAAAVAAGLVALTGTAVVPGLPDAGALVRYGLPAAKAVAESAAVLTIGSVLFAAFLAPPEKSGVLGVSGYAALRGATWFGALWCVASALVVPLTVADTLGRPLSDVLDIELLRALVPRLDTAEAWLLTAGIAGVVAACSRAVLRWGWTPPLLALAIGGVLPVAFSGHSSAGGSHDIATNSLLYHLIAAALWVGGLAALLLFGRRAGEHLGVAVRRFSSLALVCWVAMAISGVLNALVRVPLDAVLTSTYGLLIVGKVAALLALGVLGYWQRLRSVRAVVERGDRASLARLGAVEVLIMLGTIGLAVALARTPPPVGERRELTATELLLGYQLNGEPTLARLLFDWRFDLVYGVAAIAAAAVYLAGVRRLRRRGDRWSAGRTLAWLAGCAVILLATSSGIGRYAPAMFSIHMVLHMMLSMMAPALLVLGGPVTLALRALRPARDGAPPGAREWLLAALHSPVARVLTHPIVTLVLFVGSFYALYFSGLFDEALSRHWAHLAMNAHFLLVGYLFYWPLIGVDPAPRRLPPLGRLGLMFASLPFHAFFGIILMSSASVIGAQVYSTLALPWVPDLLADQRLGGGLAWASGEVPLLLVLLALLTQWARADERQARRADRRADADGDAELAAYNAMLREIAERKPR